MSYFQGKTSLETAVNLIEKIEEKSKGTTKNYPKLSGYTRYFDGTHMAAMLKQKEDGEGILVSVSYSTEVSGIKSSIGHANDCTAYDGVYYFAIGSDTNPSNMIKRYNLNLKHISPDYQCPGMTKVTCIAHIKGNYFFLGNGLNLKLCKKNDSNHTFDVVDGFTLPEQGTVIDGWIRQGMCVYDDLLYKVYGKKTDDRIRKNYIAKFALKGTIPNYTGISLRGVYECNREEKYLFEAESIDVSHDGAYIAIDRRNDNITDLGARIYEVDFYDYK